MNDLYKMAKAINANLKDWRALRPLSVNTGFHWRLERLWTAAPFQVEKVVISPETIVPVHMHEHVDSCEIYVDGDFDYEVLGHKFRAHPLMPAHRRIIMVPANTYHGGYAPHGAVFLSVQHWLDGKPRPISDDWFGFETQDKAQTFDF